MKVTSTPAAVQAPPMKQPTEPAPRIATFGPRAISSSPPAVWLHPLVWKPQAFRRRTRLPEDVDRHAAAGIPISADAQPLGFHLIREPLPDADRHVFVEAAMVAVGAEEQLHTLRFDDRLAGRTVDDQVGETRLAGHRAQRGEL